MCTLKRVDEYHHILIFLFLEAVRAIFIGLQEHDYLFVIHLLIYHAH